MRQSKLVGTLAVLPSFVIVAGFMAFPVMFAFYISFTKTNGLTYDWRGLVAQALVDHVAEHSKSTRLRIHHQHSLHLRLAVWFRLCDNRWRPWL